MLGRLFLTLILYNLSVSLNVDLISPLHTRRPKLKEEGFDNDPWPVRAGAEDLNTLSTDPESLFILLQHSVLQTEQTLNKYLLHY